MRVDKLIYSQTKGWSTPMHIYQLNKLEDFVSLNCCLLEMYRHHYVKLQIFYYILIDL